MNLKVNLGIDTKGDKVEVDLGKENLRSILLVGSTGSGKSVFHFNLYKQLIENNSPEDLKLALFDFLHCDFLEFKSPHLLFPPVKNLDEAIERFDELGKESVRQANGKAQSRQTILIHIEECHFMDDDVVSKRFIKAYKEIVKHRDKNNMIMIYSSSRPNNDVFPPMMRSNADIIAVFNLSSALDSNFILGDKSATKLTLPGQRILVFKSKRIMCKPFSDKDVRKNENFFV